MTDAPVMVRLLAVQDHDTTIDQLRHRLATLPQRAAVAAHERHRAELDARHAEVAGRRHALERTQRRLEDEVEGVAAKVVANDRTLYAGTISNLREIRALQEGIESLKRRQSALEDELLEVMEAADPVDAELAELAGEAERLDAAAAGDRAALEQAAGEVEEHLGREEAARAEAVADVPAELLATYEALRTRLGGIAVARLEGNRCLGCHLTLPATEVDAVRRQPPGTLVRHEECGRILVRPEG